MGVEASDDLPSLQIIGCPLPRARSRRFGQLKRSLLPIAGNSGAFGCLKRALWP